MPMNLKKILNNPKGFASFEFAWSALVFVLLLMVFFQFFKMFTRSEQTLVASAYKAFHSVGQTYPYLGTGITQPGLVVRGEVEGMFGCVLDCTEYTAFGPIDVYNFGAGSMVQAPQQSTFLILED